MPRKKSVILSPTEKKAMLGLLKSSKKDAKSGLKVLNTEIKAAERARKSQDKEFAKRVKALAKELASIDIQLDKLAPKPTPDVSLSQFSA